MPSLYVNVTNRVLGLVIAPSELAELIELKRADNGGADVDFGYWDFRYYMNKHMEKEYDVNLEAVKQYFPLEVGDGGTAHS